MLLLSLHATLHFSSLEMFQKSTCINSGILFTSMTLSTDSRWTKGRDSNSIWKSSKTSSRFALEYRVKTLMHFLLMKKLCFSCLSGKTTGKSKRVKRPAKKSTKAPARGVVIREAPKMPLSKKKEKVDVTRGKGIELLSKIIPSVTNEGTYVKLGVPDVTEEESSESKAESWGNDEDYSNNKQDLSGEDSDQKNDSDDDKTQSNNENESNTEHETKENESDETKITDKAEGDEDEEMDYTTSQLYDDVDIRLNEPVDSNKWFVQEEGTDAAMTNIQQGNENPEILQVIKDAHVTLSTIQQKAEVPVTSSSHSSNLAAKFLNFSDIPHTDAEIVSPMDVHVHNEVPSQQTPTLLTVLVSVISDSSPVFYIVIPQSLPSFTPPLQ
ncbi:hypothetical protein Tco_1382291 [Tanacetum coccineum]